MRRHMTSHLFTREMIGFLLRNKKVFGVLLNRRTMSSCRRLEDKVAVITAATDGIGLAIARRLASEGAKVVVSSRKQQNVDKAVEVLRSEGHRDVCGQVCHVASKDDRQRLLDRTVETFGKPDILVSNAAVNPAMGAFLDTSEAEFDKIFAVNVKAAFLLTQAFVPHMRSPGAVVYVSSIGAYQPFPPIGAYSVSKTALLALTKAVANQCASQGIRANCVCPGVVRTRFSQPLWRSEEALKELSRVVPMARVGQPDEIAAAVAFLASADASYMTGESLVVAGGHFSRL